MKFNRATLLGGSTSCALATLGKRTNTAMIRNRIAGRELEIERNIFKCLSSRVSVQRNRTKLTRNLSISTCVIPGLPLLPGIKRGNQARFNYSACTTAGNALAENRSLGASPAPSGLHWISLVANTVERERTYQRLYSKNYRVATSKPAGRSRAALAT